MMNIDAEEKTPMIRKMSPIEIKLRNEKDDVTNKYAAAFSKSQKLATKSEAAYKTWDQANKARQAHDIKELVALYKAWLMAARDFDSAYEEQSTLSNRLDEIKKELE